MLADFQRSGKVPVLMYLLKMLRTGSASTQAAAFSGLGGMLSGPQLFLPLVDLSTKETSSIEKKSGVSHISGNKTVFYGWFIKAIVKLIISIKLTAGTTRV